MTGGGRRLDALQRKQSAGRDAIAVGLTAP
jgi:hypothetical protein